MVATMMESQIKVPHNQSFEGKVEHFKHFGDTAKENVLQLKGLEDAVGINLQVERTIIKSMNFRRKNCGEVMNHVQLLHGQLQPLIASTPPRKFQRM